MKIGAVVVCRNDNYKDFERGLIHFKSMLDTFDEVTYIDWNSPSGSFLWEIQDELPKTGKLKHFIIPPHVVNQIILDPKAQQCNEGLSRNIGIRRSDCDWVVSTNIDIIPPKREDLLKLIKILDPNTFYTISRREAPKDIVYKHGHNNWKELREELYKTIPERHFPAAVTPNDNYSLINCCGDFQIASKHVWDKIKGFEEEMIFACFVDTNIQKKAILNGFNLSDLYDPPLFHIEHGAYYTKEDGTRVSDLEHKGAYTGDSKAYNDPWDWVEWFSESKNLDTWGLNGIEIEYEII
jgi:hypothetical protein